NLRVRMHVNGDQLGDIHRRLPPMIMGQTSHLLAILTHDHGWRLASQLATVKRRRRWAGFSISSMRATAKSSADTVSAAGESAATLYVPVRSPGAITGAGEKNVQSAVSPSPRTYSRASAAISASAR